MAKVKTYKPSMIDAIKAGDTVSEVGTAGLIAAGNKDGTVSWRYLRKTKTGKVFKATLGSTATFSIIEARGWAREFNNTIERGDHPAAKAAEVAKVSAEEEARLAMTVEKAWGLYKSWVEAKVEAGDMSPGTLRMKCSRFKVDILPGVGTTPLSDITLADLEAIVTKKFTAGHPTAANHLVRELGAFFGWCRKKGKALTGGLPNDPTDDLEPPSENRAKTRFLDDDEIGLLLRALAEDDMDPLVIRIYLLLLLSGQRLDNVLRAQTFDWKEHRATWEIPEARTDDQGSQSKTSVSYVIPLAAWGQAIFKSGDETWVFPSSKGTGPRCGTIKYTYDDIRERMQKLAPKRMVIRPWTPHDFRRTIRTHLPDLDVEDHIAEAVLGHAVSGIRKVYDQYKYVRQKRAALKLWEDKVRSIAIKAGVAYRLGTPVAEVVRLAA